MKQLQNNFTTPKQSKRLLELGVPRYSSDGYRNLKGYRYSLDGILDVELFFKNFPDFLPCWSVGRLIEICKICGSYKLAKEIYGRALMYLNIVDGCICEMSYEINKGNLNLSKLEE